MGFILGVLILGALLSTIFGRRVGAMFVTGTATVVGIFFGIILLALSPLIWDYMKAPSNSPPAYSGFVADQTTEHVQPTYQYSTPAPESGSSTSASVPVPYSEPAPVSVPIIGVVDGQSPSQQDQATLRQYYNIPQGVGDTVFAVTPGSR